MPYYDIYKYNVMKCMYVCVCMCICIYVGGWVIR